MVEGLQNSLKTAEAAAHATPTAGTCSTIFPDLIISGLPEKGNQADNKSGECEGA